MCMVNAPWELVGSWRSWYRVFFQLLRLSGKSGDKEGNIRGADIVGFCRVSLSPKGGPVADVLAVGVVSVIVCVEMAHFVTEELFVVEQFPILSLAPDWL